MSSAPSFVRAKAPTPQFLLDEGVFSDIGGAAVNALPLAELYGSALLPE